MFSLTGAAWTAILPQMVRTLAEEGREEVGRAAPRRGSCGPDVRIQVLSLRACSSSGPRRPLSRRSAPLPAYFLKCPFSHQNLVLISGWAWNTARAASQLSWLYASPSAASRSRHGRAGGVYRAITV